MTKILTIIGARPQFIKAAAVSRSIAQKKELSEVIVHTGQHFDENMSRVFFDELQIPQPRYNLEIHSLNHGAMTGRMTEKIEELIILEKPDLLMVYGDTNSTLAGALAAVKLHVPVAHVEAGLRSFNMQMPEEINRILTDRISYYLFCPTEDAVHNLEKEGFRDYDCQIFKTGDVMYDVALFYSEKAQKPSIDLPAEFILATLHRAENTDNIQRLASILSAFTQIGSKVPLIIPIHPRTKAIIEKNNLLKGDENILFVEPQGYLHMVYLLKNCQMVMTDSGGLQKEAYYFEKPCVTLREETEWTELTATGVNMLGGFEKDDILRAYEIFRESEPMFPEGLYGNGNAAENITNVLGRIH